MWSSVEELSVDWVVRELGRNTLSFEAVERRNSDIDRNGPRDSLVAQRVKDSGFVTAVACITAVV